MISAIAFGKGECSHLLFTGGNDRGIHIWDCHSGEMLGRITTHKQKINALYTSDDGNYLVSVGADKVMFVWDIVNQYTIIGQYRCEEECLCVTMDNQRIICGYSSGAIRVWPIANESTAKYFENQLLCNLDANSEPVHPFRLE